MKRNTPMYGLLGLIATLSLSSPLLAAEVTQKDLLVIARTIALVDNGPKGEVKIAVVGGTAESSASAEAFLSLVGSGKTVGNVTLSATQVSPASIVASGAQVVLIPE